MTERTQKQQLGINRALTLGKLYGLQSDSPRTRALDENMRRRLENIANIHGLPFKDVVLAARGIDSPETEN